MDPSWLLDTMSLTAALGPHLFYHPPQTHHTPFLLLFFLPLSAWVPHTLPFVSPWTVMGREEKGHLVSGPCSRVASTCSLSPHWPFFQSSFLFRKCPQTLLSSPFTPLCLPTLPPE